MTATLTPSAMSLKLALRRLWSDHVIWTREYVVAAVAGLSIWYLVRPQPLLVQGEVDATRFDIAARVDGRVGAIPVERGQDVAAGAVLVKIDNPETIAKHEQAQAAKDEKTRKKCE